MASHIAAVDQDFEDHGDERQPLIQPNHVGSPTSHATRKALLYGGMAFAFLIAIVILAATVTTNTRGLPRNPKKAALVILSQTPVIDGHIDLPILVRAYYHNNVTDVDLAKDMPGHVDIARLTAGKVGAFFWSVYVACPQAAGYDDGIDFTKPSYRVRDTLEQIDVARLLIDKYPDSFQMALSSSDIKNSIKNKKIASLLGVEGAHQLGNSIGVLRTYYQLGVRYVTLTHTCSNAFADSCGFMKVPPPVHNGISPLGRSLVKEMNRIGMLVDLSHTADSTAAQVLELSEAPVIWSHSSARAIHNVPRNVPDEILGMIGEGEGKKDAVVMVNFAPFFVAPPGKATTKAVADHVEHIAKVAGKRHVGIGSDFDGIDAVPVGLEDVSQYPNLFAELYTRGWTQEELGGLAGNNLLRVFEAAERVAAALQREGRAPVTEIYDKRTDL